MTALAGGKGGAAGDAGRSRGRARELAVLVGASGAFGAAITRRLLGAGLDVVAVGRRAGALDELRMRLRDEVGAAGDGGTDSPTTGHAAAGELIACAADIGDDAAIDAIRASLDRPVRMLVHGPGVAVAGGILDAPTSALVDAVNLKCGGLIRLVRAADDRLARGARIVAIGGHYGFEPSAYAAAPGIANAALVNLVRQLSLVYGGRGITAHLVAPGPADTERLRRVATERARQRGIALDDVLDEMRAESSTASFTTPEQVAWAVAMLLDPAADAMTGSTLMLDSGRRRGLP